MFRKYSWLFLPFFVLIIFLSACSPKEVVVTPISSVVPQPVPTQPVPSSSPASEPIPAPVCLLEGDEIVSLCDTAFSHNAMLTADGRLLAWGEVPFDTEKCILCQDNGAWSLNIYELPLENITGAWLGRSSILALDKDGVLWGMGSNVHGQLWNAEAQEGWDAPVKLTDHVASASISQWYYSAALKDDGSVWLMGHGKDMTGETHLPPTQVAKIKGAVEIYAGGGLYVRDEDGVSWRVKSVDEFLDDPTAVASESYSGIRWLREDLWLTDEGELVRTLPDGGEETLLTDVADVDLSYDIFSTAVTKDGDLYVWSEEMEEQFSVIVSTPTKVMEGVKLAGASEHGVVVVTEADGAVWVVYGDTLNAALTGGHLVELPV